MLVTVTHGGYIKRTPLSLYRTQRRGGRGKIGATTAEEDFVEQLVSVSTHDRLFFFTSIGKVYALKAYELPEGGRAAKGRSIANLLSLEAGETLSAFLPLPQDLEGKYLLFATRRGVVKKTELSQYENVRANGIIAILLEDGDALIGVRITDGNQEVVLSTRQGQAIRFKEDEVRAMGRSAYGVNGMDLRQGRRGGVDGDGARGRDPADGFRTRLRQAHPGLRVPPDPSWRQGRDHDAGHRQDRRGGKRPPGRD